MPEVSEVPGRLRFTKLSGGGSGPRVGVIDGAIGGPDRFASLAAIYPQVAFVSAGPSLLAARQADFEILIAAVDASSAVEVDDAVQRLKRKIGQVVIVLHNADVVTTRRLIREGAADVLPGPAGELALAACIERWLSVEQADGSAKRTSNEVVAFLKAGGGVGATALATQIACILARREGGEVCVADFDLQFGCVSLYLDLADAMTVDDALSAGDALAETSFNEALARHRTGARVLAGPREVTPLEALSPNQAEVLIGGLKRDFALTLIDLPSVWTAWTNRVLQAADRLVLVTSLSVAHLHMVRRQLHVIAAQGLDALPLVLVCNAVTGDQQGQVSLKTAERALGRGFDAMIPDDRRVMSAAINEGQPIASVRRGTKLEKAVAELADKVAMGALAATPQRGLFR
jgi:pilus assembly protein CpaE